MSRQKQEAALAVARAGVEKGAVLKGAVMRHAAAKEATEAASRSNKRCKSVRSIRGL